MPIRNRRALTQAELVVSVLLTGILATGAARSSVNLLRGRIVNSDLARAKDLAQLLLTEVTNENYIDGTNPVFGVESGEATGNRSQFDDVDDYHNLSESPPKERNGTAISNLSGWQWDAVVEWVNPGNPSATIGNDQGAKRITVTVRRNNVVLARQVAIRTSEYLP